MKIYQSKIQNRSTSSSDYFKQRFVDSQVKQIYKSTQKDVKHGTNTLYPSQTGKLTGEYEIFKHSQKLNQQKNKVMNTEVKSPKCKQNPFLSSHYGKVFRDKQDQIQENKNSCRNPRVSQIKFNQNRHKLKKHQSKPTFQSQQYISQQVESISSEKQNFNFHPSQTRASSQSHDLHTPNFNHSTINEPHILLQHIHFTISNQNNITNAFKGFATSEKQKISRRFDQIQREMENSLNQIKIVYGKRVDQQYKSLLQRLKSIKSMAQSVWKHKSSSFKSSQDNYLKQISNANQTIHPSQYSTSQRNRSSQPKYTYMRLSQPNIKSPQSNSHLLSQLRQQDDRLQEYKETKKNYFGDSHKNDQNGSVGRSLLLEQMYQLSCNVALTMDQCQRQFCDQINQGKYQKHKLNMWLIQSKRQKSQGKYHSQFSQRHQNKSGINEYFNKSQEQFGISSQISKELSQLNIYITDFRQNLRHKYLSDVY